MLRGVIKVVHKKNPSTRVWTGGGAVSLELSKLRFDHGSGVMDDHKVHYQSPDRFRATPKTGLLLRAVMSASRVVTTMATATMDGIFGQIK